MPASMYDFDLSTRDVIQANGCTKSTTVSPYNVKTYNKNKVRRGCLTFRRFVSVVELVGYMYFTPCI